MQKQGSFSDRWHKAMDDWKRNMGNISFGKRGDDTYWVQDLKGYDEQQGPPSGVDLKSCRGPRRYFSITYESILYGMYITNMNREEAERYLQSLPAGSAILRRRQLTDSSDTCQLVLSSSATDGSGMIYHTKICWDKKDENLYHVYNADGSDISGTFDQVVPAVLSRSGLTLIKDMDI